MMVVLVPVQTDVAVAVAVPPAEAGLTVIVAEAPVNPEVRAPSASEDTDTNV